MTEKLSYIQIELHEDLDRELERLAVPFEDTSPVDVIRRLVNMPSPYAKPWYKGSQQDGHLLVLIRHGLIAAGDELVYERPRRGDSFTATVTDNGWLALSDGRKARSPSGAVMLLVGKTDNGFKVWRHIKSGKKLEELRAEISVE